MSSTELRAAGSKLYFQEIELAISPAASVVKSAQPYYVARFAVCLFLLVSWVCFAGILDACLSVLLATVVCVLISFAAADSELVVTVGRIQNSEDFDGRLSFLKIAT